MKLIKRSLRPPCLHIQARLPLKRVSSHFLCTFPHNLSPDAQRLRPKPHQPPTIFSPMEKCVTKIKRPALFKLSSPQSPRPPLAYSPNLSRTLLFQTDDSRSNIIVFKTLVHLVKRPDTRQRQRNGLCFFQCDSSCTFCNEEGYPGPSTDFFLLTIRSSRKREEDRDSSV